MKRILSALLLILVSSVAYCAQGKPVVAKAASSPVEDFKATTEQEMKNCGGITIPPSARNGEMEYIAANEPRKACILAGHAKARSIFLDALKQVESNPKASALLQEFYTSWLASFDNVGQGGRESFAQYQKRSADEKVKSDALWKSFKKALAKKK